MTTLHVIYSNIDNKLFAWDKLSDNKLLPKNIANRLKSASLRIERIQTSSEDIELKIQTINDAHEAAESRVTPRVGHGAPQRFTIDKLQEVLSFEQSKSRQYQNKKRIERIKEAIARLR